jgi:hypothetical protein
MKKWNREQQEFLDSRIYDKYPEEPIPDEGEKSRKYRALVEFMKKECGVSGISHHCIALSDDSGQTLESLEVELGTRINVLEKDILVFEGLRVPVLL